MSNAERNSKLLQHSTLRLQHSLQHSAFDIQHFVKVILIGPPAARARLSEALPDGLDVVGETRTLAEARSLPITADAWLVAATSAGEFYGNDQDELEGREPLTPRELEVLELLAQGLPNKAIAARLGISDQTVKFHVAAICGKLGAVNRTDAARRALRKGVIAL